MTADRGQPDTAIPADSPTPQAADETIYAIGDIHGCYRLMVEMLDRIVRDVTQSGAENHATLVFLGDYIDRGPDSADVLTALIWLERHAPLPIVFLRGNHEQVMLDYLDDPIEYQDWLRLGGAATLASYGIAVPDGLASPADHAALRDQLVDTVPSSHVGFLRRLQLYSEAEYFIFVHAGIRAGVPMGAQKAEDLLWIRDGFLEDQPPLQKRIVHGHTWVGDKPEVKAHRIGVDTGAYETGVLTAVRLQGKNIDFISTAD